MSGRFTAPLLAIGLLAASSTANAQLVINEIDYDQPGSDTAEFIELKNTSAAPIDLSLYRVELVNGANGGNALYATFVLPQVNLAGGSYFVICANAATTINCDLDVAPNTNLIQNGSPDGLRIVRTSDQAIIDGMAYEGSMSCCTEGTALPLTPADDDTTPNFGYSRFPDGVDANDNLADFSLRCITPGSANVEASTSCPTPVGPTQLSINDVTVTEGDSGTVVATFTVSLSAAAGAGGVSFDIATADGTATVADNDYVARSLTAQSIAEGASSFIFAISVNGDNTPEANETFFVNVSNVVGVVVVDAQGQGTILNDDFIDTSISAVQGAGVVSPLAGQPVSLLGIVTSRVNNGFYLQSQLIDQDSDPNTSEGMFVFTSSAPPATAAVGNLLQVTGTVVEFIPSNDPNQQPLTQLTGPTIGVLTSGNPLPAPIDLTTLLPAADGGIEQLERFENMRVRVPLLTVVAPTGGTISESNATSSSNGRFYGVVGATPRPFREPGLEIEDAAGQLMTIPRWDNNPEKLNIESVRARNAANAVRTAIDVDVGATLTDVVGVLDYSFRNHRITVDFDAAPVVSGGRAPVAVSQPTGSEITVAGYNLQRFFDNVDDPAIGEPVLSTTAFQNRLQKTSLGIRQFLRTPDFIGVSEVENLATLQALATRINSDAVTAGQPDPQYVARLEEGNDVGGIDVGFLVKTAPIAGSTPRVTINGALEQLGAAELLRCPDGTPTPVPGSLLNDRPSLVLNATVAAANGTTAPVTVIVNHLRSLSNVNSSAVATGADACFGTTGNRVRLKRLQQAEFIANAIQTRQSANPKQNIILVGDFNAFEFNDGFTDVMGAITGAPAPDNQTLVPGDGVDLVTPDFVNLTLSSSTPAAERYSFVFSGNAQSLDHALVSSALATNATSLRLEHARINADFGEDNRADPTLPLRVSDHDPLVLFIGLPDFGLPDAIFSNGFEPESLGD